jgi:hypothetical protein
VKRKPKIGELRCVSCGDPPFWLTKAQADTAAARAELAELQREIEPLRKFAAEWPHLYSRSKAGRERL